MFIQTSLFALAEQGTIRLIIAAIALIAAGIGTYHIITRNSRLKRPYLLIFAQSETQAVIQGALEAILGLTVMIFALTWPVPAPQANEETDLDKPKLAEGSPAAPATPIPVPQPVAPPRPVAPARTAVALPHAAVPPSHAPVTPPRAPQSDAAVPSNDEPFATEAPASPENSLDEYLKKLDNKKKALEREQNGAARGDPDYFDKMADRMSSDNSQHRSQAIDALLQADPTAAPPEAKKKVARAFKALAEDENPSLHDKAVQGLVKWAGKFSVPTLTAMLGNGLPDDQKIVIKALTDLGDPRVVPALVKLVGENRNPANAELILNALVAMKDPQAAPALAARIANRRYSQLACDALRAMGPAAEDALIAAANTPDPQVCLTAIGLLGDVGTEKCIEVMRKADASRNRAVRMAALAAVAKINNRRLAHKDER